MKQARATIAVLAIMATDSITLDGQQNDGRQNLGLPKVPNPYRTVADIVSIPAGRVRGSTNAINVYAKGNINAPGQYDHNPGSRRGIRTGSVNDGVVTTFVPDPAPKSPASVPDGITVGKSGVMWSASIGDRQVMTFVRITRR